MNYKRLIGIVAATIVLILVALPLLFYAPPFQRWAVGKVAAYASEKTGMTVKVGSLRLAFPLELKIEDVLVANESDTLLDVHSLSTDVRLLPLFQGQLYIDGLELENGRINTLNLIESFRIEGTFGKINIKGSELFWKKNKFSLDNIALEQGDVRVQLIPTESEDSTSVASPWMIDVRTLEVHETRVEVSSEELEETIDVGIRLLQATRAHIDLGTPVYTIEKLNWMGSASYGNDYQFDSLDLQASSMGYEGRRIILPQLSLKVDDSVISTSADINLDALEDNGAEAIDLQIHSLFNKTDIARFLPSLPHPMMREWPDEPLEVTAAIGGNLKRLNVSSFRAQLPTAFWLTANGNIAIPSNQQPLKADILIEGTTENLRFLTASFDPATRKSFTVPAGMRIDGNIRADDSDFAADVRFNLRKGTALLKARYDNLAESYSAKLQTSQLPLRLFLPAMPLSPLSATLSVQGRGMDFSAPLTSLKASAEVDQLSYENFLLDGLCVDASLDDGQWTALMASDNPQLRGSFSLSAKVSDGFSLSVGGDIEHLDLAAMQIVDSTLTFDARGHIGFSMDSRNDSTRIAIDNGDLHLLAHTSARWQALLPQADSLAAEWQRQWQARRIDQTKLRERLPKARLTLTAGRDNILSRFLATNDYTFSRANVDLNTSPADGVNGLVSVDTLWVSGIQLDALGLSVITEEDSTAYNLTIVNGADNPQYTFGATLSGFLTENGSQMVVGLNDERGVRAIDLGVAATLVDEGVRFSFSDTNPLLGYVRFVVNEDNFLLLDNDERLSADILLKASDGTGVQVYTNDDNDEALQDVTISLNHFDLATVLDALPYTPNITGLLNGDFHLIQTEEELSLSSNLAVEHLAYEQSPVGNVGTEFVYVPKADGSHYIDGQLMIGDDEVATVRGSYNSGTGLDAVLGLTRAPLSIINGFIPNRIIGLDGFAEGELTLKGSVARPELDGEVMLTSSSLYSEPYGVTLRFADDPVRIEHSRILFENFELFANNASPLNVVGQYDFSDFSHMNMDIRMQTQDFLLVDAKENPRSEAFGKAYVNFYGSMRGPVESLTMQGRLDVLGSTNLSYILRDSELANDTQLDDLVKFINFEDTTTVVSVERPPIEGFTMDLNVGIDEAAHIFCALNADKSNFLDINGGGNLRLRYTSPEGLSLTGRYTLDSGRMKYSLPVIPLKTFTISQGSYIEFTGDMMNPTLNITATENVKATVGEGTGSGRPVDFVCGVQLSQTLSHLGLSFVIDAQSDNVIRDELNTMSAEERGKVAITMLASGMYLADGNTSGFTMNSALSSFLQSEINNIASSAMRSMGLDLTMGIDNATNSSGEMRTDYNFQFSKRLLNNRLNFIVGGKLSTGSDVSERDDSFFDNVELQYRLNQNASQYLRLFYDNNTYDWLEGFIGQYGVGFLWKRKLQHFRDIFKFKNSPAQTIGSPALPVDTVKTDDRRKKK